MAMMQIDGLIILTITYDNHPNQTAVFRGTHSWLVSLGCLGFWYDSLTNTTMRIVPEIKMIIIKSYIMTYWSVEYSKVLYNQGPCNTYN